MEKIYTHNLKIILVDESGKIILEDGFLEEIKDKLCKINKESEVWDGKEIDIIMKWERKELNNIERELMGDLYINSAYDIDSIIVNHTKGVIGKINNRSNYGIKFYISRVIGDKKICRDSYL